MHDLLLGPAGDSIANGLVELGEDGLLVKPDGTPFAAVADAYSAVQADMRQWFRRLGISSPAVAFTQSTLGRDSKMSYPELSSKFKAAHVKYMSFYMAHLTHRLGGSDYRSKVRCALFWGLATFISVLDAGGRWLNDAEIQEATQAGMLFLQAYTKLAGIALAGMLGWGLGASYGMTVLGN